MKATKKPKNEAAIKPKPISNPIAIDRAGGLGQSPPSARPAGTGS